MAGDNVLARLFAFTDRDNHLLDIAACFKVVRQLEITTLIGQGHSGRRLAIGALNPHIGHALTLGIDHLACSNRLRTIYGFPTQ